MSPPVSWRQIWRLCVAVAAIAVLGAIAPIVGSTYREHTRNAVHPTPASDAEQEQLLRAVIETVKYEGLPPAPPIPGEEPQVRSAERKHIMLLDRSSVVCVEPAPGESPKASCALGLDEGALPFVDPAIPRQLIRELLVANREQYPTPAPMLPFVTMVSPEQVAVAFANGRGWDHFYEVYPDSAGTLAAARAVLSPDKVHALIFVENRCDGLCGTGYLHYMAKSRAGWVIERSFRVWVS